MKNIKASIYASLLLLLSGAATSSETDDAVLYGNLLAKAVEQKQDIQLKRLPESKSIKAYLSDNKCPGFSYRGYIVGPEQKQFLYLIASNKKDVIIGRHFKMPIKSSSIDIASAESSTNGCLNLGTPPRNVAALTATHLKPYPNEFHVLQSQLAGLSLYIGTSTGIYSIEKGEIRMVESK